MFRPGEYANKAPQNELETALRLLRLKLWTRRLVSDDELQFGNEVGHEPCIQLERLQKRAAPDRQFGVALAEKRPYKALKCLHQGRIGNVALVLIELACGEESSRWSNHHVQLIDDRGFSNAGISRDEHQFRRAALDHAVEGREQDVGLAFPAVQLLGYQQPIGGVMLAKRELHDVPVSVPLGKTTP